MSEYARAVIELPAAPERREAEREANKLFKKRATELAALSPATNDDVNTAAYRPGTCRWTECQVGYSWPSQESISAEIRMFETARCKEQPHSSPILKLAYGFGVNWTARIIVTFRASSA